MIRKMGAMGLLLISGAILSPAAALAAVLVSSTFDVDDEGWLFWDGQDPVVLTAPTHLGSGGNPGGFIQIEDVADPNFFFVASDAYTGDQSAAFGGMLTFDQFNRGDGGAPIDLLEDVVLVGAGLTLTIDLPDLVDADWQTREVLLIASAGWVVQSEPGPGDPPATDAELLAVLSDLDFLLINGEFRNGVDISGLDNVSLSAVPLPPTWPLLLGSLMVLGYQRRRR